MSVVDHKRDVRNNRRLANPRAVTIPAWRADVPRIQHGFTRGMVLAIPKANLSGARMIRGARRPPDEQPAEFAVDGGACLELMGNGGIVRLAGDTVKAFGFADPEDTFYYGQGEG